MSRRRLIASARRRLAAAAAPLLVGQFIGWNGSDTLTTWETTNSINIPLGHEFGDNAQWTFFENGTNFATWETWVNAKAGRRFSYSAPLLTANDDTGLTKAQKFAALAAGTYDVHFTNLGNAFQARPALRNAIVRLGWEFNGNTFPWAVPPNDQAILDNYKAGFNRAAAALKTACPTLEIEWCPNVQLDYTNRTFADMYPGDAYIDYIGIGLYDYYWPGGSPTQAQREAWLRDSVNGLADQVALATARGKKLAHTEWGLWTTTTQGGGGDRPAFIDFIADWYAQYNYSYSIYNNVGATGLHKLDDYPLSKARYLARFGGATPPPPPPVPTIAWGNASGAVATAPAPSWPAGNVGDVLILAVGTKGTATINTPAGWTPVLNSAVGGGMKLSLFQRTAPDANTGTVTTSVTGADTSIGIVGRTAAGVTVASTSTGADATLDTAYSATGASTAYNLNDLIVAISTYSFSSTAFAATISESGTAAVGATATHPRGSTTVGTDMSMTVHSAPVTAAGTSTPTVAGTFTATAGGTGVAAFLTVRGT